MSANSLAMTAQQRHELDENGFVVLESFFQGEELAKLVRGVEALRQRNQQSAQTSTDGVPIVAEADPTCLELLDHPRVLPYVVDAMGWNIHARDCLFTAQPPRSGAATPGQLALPWHHDQEEEFTGLTQDGTMPLVELKVSYYLSDHAEAGHACTLVVPGSHRWSAEQRASWERTLRPADVVPLRVPLGSVMLWRSSLLHSVAPHLAGSWRYHLFVSYIPRWVRPSHRGNFSTAGHPDPARNGPLLARSSPVRRQLLGAMGDGSALEASQFWFPRDAAQLPLKQWAQERLPAGGAPMRWGTTGYGVSFSRVLFAGGAVTAAQEQSAEDQCAAARIALDSESPQYRLLASGEGGYRNLMNDDMQPEWLRPDAWRELRAAAPPHVPAEGGDAAALAAETSRLAAENSRLKAKLVQLRGKL